MLVEWRQSIMCLGWVVFLSDPAYPEKGLKLICEPVHLAAYSLT